MSHQSGIRANDELRRFFASCKDGHVRVIKIVIKSGKNDPACADDLENNEQLALADQRSVRNSFENDFKSLVASMIEENLPCYLLVRLDSIGQVGYDWLFISHIPDTSPVRLKMVYAATRATLKKEFGGGNIKEEFHACCREDASFDGYLRYKRNKASPGPMTEVEQELNSARTGEQTHHAGGTFASQTLQGVAFPIDQTALEKLSMLRDGLITYVQLSVDTLNEAIKLERFDSISTHQLKHQIPKNHPRYHFYVFKHQYEGDHYNSVVFLYSMPSQGCSVKEKMLYSSCKNPFLDTVQRYLGLTIDRKVEIDCTEDLNEAYLIDEVHPKIHLHAPLFARPQGPKHLGQRRINRPVL